MDCSLDAFQGKQEVSWRAITSRHSGEHAGHAAIAYSRFMNVGVSIVFRRLSLGIERLLIT